MASMNLRVIDDDIDLTLLIKNSGNAGESILKACGKVIKARVIGNLNAIKYVPKNKDGSDRKRRREIHMADDVKSRIVTDKYGYKTLKISGGKQTGTLWHIVNDGTFKTRATHFMDNAVSTTEKEVEKIIDQEMKKAGF